MYNGFFGMAALSLLPAAHCVYLWRRRPEQKTPWRRGAKAFLIVLAALYGCAVAAGVVVALAKAEPTASHAMGLMALVLSLWFDYRFGRNCNSSGDREV